MGDAYKSVLRTLGGPGARAGGGRKTLRKLCFANSAFPVGIHARHVPRWRMRTLRQVRQSLESLGIWELEGVSAPSS